MADAGTFVGKGGSGVPIVDMSAVIEVRGLVCRILTFYQRFFSYYIIVTQLRSWLSAYIYMPIVLLDPPL